MSTRVSQNPPPSKQKERKVRRSRNRNRRRRNQRYNMPAAYASNTTTTSTVRQNRNGRATLTFREIFPLTMHSLNETVDLVLPFSPCKWLGTRTSTLCSTYSSFRPKRVRVTYRPTRGSSNSGAVAVGCIFDGAAAHFTNRDNGFQALTASNGGYLTNIWKPHSSMVALQTSLRANTFPLYNVDPDDIPFYILAIVSGVAADTAVGYIEISATLTLHNPLTNIIPNSCSDYVNAEFEDTSTTEQTSTILKVPLSAFNSVPVTGDDFWFVAGRNLLNRSQEVFTRILAPFHGESQGVDANNQVLFKVDSYYAPSTALLRMIGAVSQNF